MKILLDPQIFNAQKFGGISRYFSEIYKYIHLENPQSIVLPLIYTENLHIKEIVTTEISLWDKMALQFSFLRRKVTRKLKRKNKRCAQSVISAGNFDLFIPTYYDTYFLDLIGNKPFVLTVYDMIHELFPQYFKGDLYTVKNKKELMEKATKIIAISESTKNDILKFYPHINASKIEVIYLSQSIDPKNYTEVELPKSYILFVGNREGYKNFTFFLKSIYSLLQADGDLHIVCAGGNKFNSDEIRLIQTLNISNQIIQNNFEDRELASYYKNAICFVFPSEYEGFGIPVLESMACGCPVVLAHHSSFPEVAGDAGVYFELNNEVDLKDKVVSLIDNEVYRNQIIQKGFLQSAKFSWKKTAQECTELFKSTIKNE